MTKRNVHHCILKMQFCLFVVKPLSTIIIVIHNLISSLSSLSLLLSSSLTLTIHSTQRKREWKSGKKPERNSLLLIICHFCLVSLSLVHYLCSWMHFVTSTIFASFSFYDHLHGELSTFWTLRINGKYT